MQTITFPHSYINPEDIAEGINLENPEESIEDLQDPDTTVINFSDIRIKYNYPLGNPVIFSYHSDFGFSRANLARIISKQYHRMYDQENESILNQGLPESVETHGPYNIEWNVPLNTLTLISMRNIGDNLYTLEIE